MLIKYYINDSKICDKNHPITISTQSEVGKALLSELKRYKYYESKITSIKLPITIKELGITIAKIGNPKKTEKGVYNVDKQYHP